MSRSLLAGLAALVLLFFVVPAHGYPWMIRHDYTACGQCHVDPTGGGNLTRYGRAMGDVLLRTQYGERSTEESVEPGPNAEFFWGTVPLPDELDFSGSFRVLGLMQKVASTPGRERVFLMQSDLTTSVQTGRFVASGSLGYSAEGGTEAAITRNPSGNIVSRYHWMGLRLDEEQAWLVRAGRLNLPFGIRDVQHTLWVRSTTRTSIDDSQQHGLALSYAGAELRGEVMAILGNYQIRPDDFRERGGSGFVEWSPAPRVAVGASSRLVHVQLDPRLLRQTFRHAHGLFGRWSPARSLVLASEVDYVVDSFEERPREQGLVTMAQLDFEPVQGLHYQLTGEAQDFGPHGSDFAVGGWASFLWFFASHMDLRLDGVFHSIPSAAGATSVQTLLAQVHLYL